ncbi:hypothetical protein DdX_11724 [Ditylenchus destructor]|uniref:Uncharacterized protein n=1 Tax=Ditylenchus destructor TaxID=166010 RepID=A0AAD4MWC8_9BILA|nr:hypothetical protein DdX_11724 [Ditylenchus destructor]
MPCIFQSRESLPEISPSLTIFSTCFATILEGLSLTLRQHSMTTVTAIANAINAPGGRHPNTTFPQITPAPEPQAIGFGLQALGKS